MKIAICQMHIKWEDKEINLRKIEAFCSEAKCKDADIIFFPEMTCTGFTMNTDYSSDTDNNLYTLERVKKIARNNAIAIGLGWVKKPMGKGKCENHYTVVNATGGVISDYVKIHPFSYSGENDYFDGGNNIVKYYLNGIPFSTFICYDLRFPEVFRSVATDVHAIVVPANWPKKRREHWISLLKARAIENQVYIIGVNCVGDIGGFDYSGDSMIITPDGKVLATCTPDNEEIACYTLIDDVNDIRDAFPVLMDRKPEVYSRL